MNEHMFSKHLFVSENYEISRSMIEWRSLAQVGHTPIRTGLIEAIRKSMQAFSPLFGRCEAVVTM
jgi:hypothetical protein